MGEGTKYHLKIYTSIFCRTEIRSEPQSRQVCYSVWAGRDEWQNEGKLWTSLAPCYDSTYTLNPCSLQQ